MEHFRGVGTISPEMVRQRARELARIAGRPAHEWTANDWLQARKELLCQSTTPSYLEDSPEDELESPEGEDGVRGTNEDTAGIGHHKPNRSPPDPQQQTEELVQGGVDEAEHDRMVAATKEK